MHRVGVVGTGLIGGSIGLALRERDVEVVAFDVERAHAERAKELGAVDRLAEMPSECADADVVVIAAPVSRVAEIAATLLDAGAPVVTDVGSVKGPVVRALERERPERAASFVGGHPMAGSEQEGVEGAEATLFEGSTWVVTPTASTDPAALGTVRRLLGLLGAEMLALDPDDHDSLVAVVSHVPQLAASTLMDLAATRGAEHSTLLRLAAGGFRDMTRIASGQPDIWPDICVANRDAIVAALDEYLVALTEIRSLVADGDRPELLSFLARARAARRNLPVGRPAGEELVELRVPVADRPRVLADVTTRAGALDVNIADVEIAHSAEGGGGVLVLTVPASGAPRLEDELATAGYHPSIHAIE